MREIRTIPFGFGQLIKWVQPTKRTFLFLLPMVEDLDSDGTEDAHDSDRDDGIANLLETANGSDPNDSNSANLAPTDINSTAVLNLPENTPANVIFGQILASDPDQDANLTYSMRTPFPHDLNPGAWFDADESTTLFRNRDGNHMADTHGDGLARWNDRSSNERNATMSTFRTQPLFKENYLNGRSVLRFDGTNYLNVDLGYLRTRITPSLRLKEEGEKLTISLTAVEATKGILVTKIIDMVLTSGQWLECMSAILPKFSELGPIGSTTEKVIKSLTETDFNEYK